MTGSGVSSMASASTMPAPTPRSPATALPTATATVDFTPLDPHAQAKTDGTAAGGSSNDAGEDEDGEDKPTVRPGSVDDGYD